MLFGCFLGMLLFLIFLVAPAGLVRHTPVLRRPAQGKEFKVFPFYRTSTTTTTTTTITDQYHAWEAMIRRRGPDASVIVVIAYRGLYAG
uniref:Putative secreted protein n=1 Tax=Anopheles darlingi TaxID=43151 RepID=A0A2M4DGE8_ANODA